MYISNRSCSQRVAKSCGHAAGRHATNRVPWQRNPRQRCSEIYGEQPSARTVGSGLCRRSDLILSQDSGSEYWFRPNQRALFTPTSTTSFAPRPDGHVTQQMSGWRTYLKGFKNTADLVDKRCLCPTCADSCDFFSFFESKPQVGRIFLRRYGNLIPIPAAATRQRPPPHQRAPLERALSRQRPARCFLHFPGHVIAPLIIWLANATFRPTSTPTARKR